MNKNLYSNMEFNEIKKRINKEIQRRATYSWWDPLTEPKIGNDKSTPMNIPDMEISVDEKTYTINTPSKGSIEETRNIKRPIHGDSPGGTPDFLTSVPNTSAGRFDVDEMRNFLVGLSKINDINLFYGRDEVAGTAFRNPQGIEDLLERAEQDELHHHMEFIWDVDLDDEGNLIVSYIGDIAPNVSIDSDGNLVLIFDEGDKYECISTMKFHIDNGNLIVDDVENIWHLKVDPNNGNTRSIDGNRSFVGESISTLRFNVEDNHLMMTKTWHMNFPYRFDISTDENGDLIVICPEYLSPNFYLENGEVKITWDDNSYCVKLSEEDGLYVMPSGEREGEEMYSGEGLGPNNFFDDYGAPKGDGNYHPYNKATTPLVKRNIITQDDERKTTVKISTHGGIKSSSYGQNPRNPYVGESYPGRVAYEGTPGTCDGQCTGLCFTTCDDQCSESCTSTCFSRCGNGCTSSCGNACTGCSTLCYSSCKTKCENSTGYSCVKAGAKTVKITSTGGKNGIPASNNIESTIHTCDGCSYSCQFYPNKKTECWDAACMGKCFNTCESSCSDSCSGGCIDNSNENSGNYKVGKGRGCSAGCTMNCIGSCQGVCEGQCVETCFSGCKQLCSDNCMWVCSTNCGSGCANSCKNGCKGCDTTCESSCLGSGEARTCTGCSSTGGCTSTCQNDCNGNCMGSGCRSLCGTEGSGACDFNCRINCSGSSCTSQCEDQCSAQCSTCVNTCGFQCGMCSSLCSTGCEADCDITCTAICEHSCESNCVQSCSEECGGCSNLCMSCTGMCIGVCSLKCQNGCSSCDTMCGWWCDTSCSQNCFGNCDTTCINTCMTSCVTHVNSNTTNTSGPDKDPTAIGYHTPHPDNRIEEQESFKIPQGDN